MLSSRLRKSCRPGHAVAVRAMLAAGLACWIAVVGCRLIPQSIQDPTPRGCADCHGDIVRQWTRERPRRGLDRSRVHRPHARSDQDSVPGVPRPDAPVAAVTGGRTEAARSQPVLWRGLCRMPRLGMRTLCRTLSFADRPAPVLARHDSSAVCVVLRCLPRPRARRVPIVLRTVGGASRRAAVRRLPHARLPGSPHAGSPALADSPQTRGARSLVSHLDQRRP